MKKSILFLFVIISSAVVAQKGNKFEWPEHAVTPVFQELIKAYNSNDFNALSAFTDKYYAQDEAERRAVYWTKIFSEYGILKPYKIAEEEFHGLPAIWFQGTDTKSWAKIVVMLNEDSTRIVNSGVFKSMRPNGILPPYEPMHVEEMSNYLEGYLNNLSQQDYFSGSVLVAQGDKVLFQNAYGYKNKAESQKNENETAFGLGSTTKTFTAVAIAQLAQEGKLNFSDPLSKFIPEYPKDIADQVSIHHLLTHTSGLEFDDYDPFYYETLEATSIDELLTIQLKYVDNMNEGRRENFSVLNEFDYSNDNFILLGVIIERASGMTYAEYIEKNIFNPSGMTHSIVDNNKMPGYDNKAKGYSHNNADMEFELNGRHEALGSAVCNIIMPAGGIHASAYDLYSYFKAINEHEIITSQTKDILFKKHTMKFSSKDELTHIHYGYGFMLSQNGDAFSIGHGGVDYGVGSRFEYYPEHDIYVIVLSNYGGMAGSNVADHIKDLIEPKN